jgi:hypothetical protein
MGVAWAAPLGAFSLEIAYVSFGAKRLSARYGYGVGSTMQFIPVV